MKKSAAFFFAGLITLMLACNDDDNAQASTKIIAVSTTYDCGWFPNFDSIYITPKGANHSCLKNEKGKSVNFTSNDWEDLLATIDLDTFNAFNSNSCSICVDGCDMTIAVTTTMGYHRVKFDATDDFPAEIEELATYLTALREQHQEKDCQ